ncbi:unnamed protein product [Rangifer tarandus platyrhynchus]|uniref:Uncharacterized protein n=2 Tax=Rangifer tarandus platyrhynchus TaxID=3082113 RepID=A0AC59Z760_RANTA|nr:unnamed protein product [Rangifer tarandus platyrhynchus]
MYIWKNLSSINLCVNYSSIKFSLKSAFIDIILFVLRNSLREECSENSPHFMFQKPNVQIKNSMSCLRSHNWDEIQPFTLVPFFLLHVLLSGFSCTMKQGISWFFYK